MEAAALAQAQAQAAPQAQALAQLQAYAHALGASPPPPPYPPHPPHPHSQQLYPLQPHPPQPYPPQPYPGREVAAPDYDQLVESVVRRAWAGALTRHASEHPGPFDVTLHPDHAAALHPADLHYQPATAAPPVQPPSPAVVPGHTPDRTPFSSGYGLTGQSFPGYPGRATRPSPARAKERAAPPPPRTTGRDGVGSYAVQHRRNLQRGARSGGYGIRSYGCINDQ